MLTPYRYGFLMFRRCREWPRGPRFEETSAEIRHFTTAVWGRFWALLPHWYLPSVWRRQSSGITHSSPVRDSKVLQQHVGPIWSLSKVSSFLFINVQQRYCSACYHNKDRLCKCLTSNQAGGCGLVNAALQLGSVSGSSPVSLCLLGMQRHSFLSLTQSIEFLCHIFAKLPPSLVHSRHRSACPSSPTAALIAALIQAIFLSFKKSRLGETSAADGSTQGWSKSITPFPLSPASPLPSAASLEIHPESIFARWQRALCTIHYGSGRYIVNGSLSRWHKSTVNS